MYIILVKQQLPFPTNLFHTLRTEWKSVISTWGGEKLFNPRETIWAKIQELNYLDQVRGDTLWAKDKQIV